MSKMNVLVLSHMYPNPSQPYLGIFVYQLVTRLVQCKDAEISVISPVPYCPVFLQFFQKYKKYSQIPHHLRSEGITVFFPRYLALPGKLFFPFLSFFMYFSVRRLLRNNRQLLKNCKIIHSNSLLPDGLVGYWISKKYSLRNICTLHGSDINVYPFRTSLAYTFSKHALKNIRNFIAVSKKIAVRAKNITPTISTTVIHNGADPDCFYPIDKVMAREKLHLDGNGKYLLYIGNLLPIKGIDLLLTAFSTSNVAGVTLLLVGDGPYHQHYVEMTRVLKIQHRVKFIGRVAHGDIPLWAATADVFVLPSRSEGFPTVIPEMMMCGIPIIATDVGGVSEAIINEKTGLLLPPEDCDALTCAIERMFSAHRLRQDVSSNALNFACELTWESLAKETYAAYHRVCSLD